jgi:hypothetical protein
MGFDSTLARFSEGGRAALQQGRTEERAHGGAAGTLGREQSGERVETISIHHRSST